METLPTLTVEMSHGNAANLNGGDVSWKCYQPSPWRCFMVMLPALKSSVSSTAIKPEYRNVTHWTGTELRCLHIIKN